MSRSLTEKVACRQGSLEGVNRVDGSEPGRKSVSSCVLACPQEPSLSQRPGPRPLLVLEIDSGPLLAAEDFPNVRTLSILIRTTPSKDDNTQTQFARRYFLR